MDFLLTILTLLLPVRLWAFMPCVPLDLCVGPGTTGTCTKLYMTYLCVCEDGYRAVDRTSCELVDECAEGTHTCDEVVSDCEKNSGPGYKCKCKDGFVHETGSDKKCLSILYCTLYPQICKKGSQYTSKCIQHNGYYECECHSGFEHPKDESGDSALEECQDIDECATNVHTCDLSRSVCVNTPGDYRCECSWGWKESINSNKQCEDINECTEGVQLEKTVLGCSAVAAHCLNTDGSYDCSCYAGYTPHPDADDKKKDGCRDCCVDIDECVDLTHTHQCGDLCEFGTHDSGAPVGVNYTCTCEGARFPRTIKVCAACEYGQWGMYGDCDVDCGVGVSIRRRAVTTGEGHAECEDEALTTQLEPCLKKPCEEEKCLVTAWSVWGECSETCGGGNRTRERTVKASPGTTMQECAAIETVETEECNTETCEAPPMNWTPIAIAAGGVGVLVVIGACALRSTARRGAGQEEFM